MKPYPHEVYDGERRMKPPVSMADQCVKSLDPVANSFDWTTLLSPEAQIGLAQLQQKNCPALCKATGRVCQPETVNSPSHIVPPSPQPVARK